MNSMFVLFVFHVYANKYADMFLEAASVLHNARFSKITFDSLLLGEGCRIVDKERGQGLLSYCLLVLYEF